MTLDRMDALIRRVAPEAHRSENVWEFEVEEHPVQVITDVERDRMRILVPVADSEGITARMYERLMQANFDSTLDARYAVARGFVWSLYLHPLEALGDEAFLAGLAQAVTLRATYGQTFSSGALVFEGGDSAALHDQLYNRIMDQAGDI